MRLPRVSTWLASTALCSLSASCSLDWSKTEQGNLLDEVPNADAGPDAQLHNDPGPDAQAPVYCPANACGEGGTCIDEPDWSCQCKPGFDGTGTQTCTNIDDCLAEACGAHGSCQDEVLGYRCDCQPGYSGDACEIDGCSLEPCQHGGTCSIAATGVNCACPAGYTGDRCETDIDECAGANLCTIEGYPCEQTEAPGYTCRGQFVDWPVAGSPGHPASYDTGTAGVVVDNLSGLMWQRGLPVAAGTNTPNFEGCAQKTGCTWQEAIAYCKALSLAGFDDFRLPTKPELESILDYSRTLPAIDPIVFPDTFDSYWTSSIYRNPIDKKAHSVIFSNGNLTSGEMNTANRVRCVRRARKLPPGTPDARYVHNTALGTLTDTRTGLTWRATVDAKTFTYSNAMLHCQQQVSGAFRAPSVKELQSLVDLGYFNPIVNWEAFPDVLAITNPVDHILWSASPYIKDDGSISPNSWVFETNGGSAINPANTSLYHVRCVR